MTFFRNAGDGFPEPLGASGEGALGPPAWGGSWEAQGAPGGPKGPGPAPPAPTQAPQGLLKDRVRVKNYTCAWTPNFMC